MEAQGENGVFLDIYSPGIKGEDRREGILQRSLKRASRLKISSVDMFGDQEGKNPRKGRDHPPY